MVTVSFHLAMDYTGISTFLPHDGNTMLEEIKRPINSHSRLYNRQLQEQRFGETCPFVQQDAVDVLDSIQRVVQFYENHYLSLTLMDAAVGLFVLRGQLEPIIEKFSHIRAFNETSLRLRKQVDISNWAARPIFDQAITLQKMTPFSDVIGLLTISSEPSIWKSKNSPWKSPALISKYTNEYYNIGNDREVINTFLNLQCLTAVIKTCEIAEVCQNMYLKDIYSQYMLTHQVLLLHIAEKKSCSSVPGKYSDVFKHRDNYMDRLCAKVYKEAEFLAEHKFPLRFRDLFVEQVAFCGLAKYPNFFRADWIREILSWQTLGEDGCFPNVYGDVKTADKVITFPEFVNGKMSPKACLQHYTSVSMMSLAVTLGFMADNCTPDIFNIQS